MRRICVAALGLLIPVMGVAQTAPAAAKAMLKNANGETVGDAVLTDTPHGVLIHVNLTHAPTGAHAFHIHETGQCQPPFTTAGDHFNPTHKQHGLENAMGMHAGDLPNINVPASGVYSQALKGPEYMAIATELETHAQEELQHAITIAKHIDYLGGTPTTKALPVAFSEKPKELLRADLENENTTIRHYRERVRQCEALDEYAIAEDIRDILRQEQEHQTELATALGEDTPDVSRTSRARR